ncbi:neural tube development [Vermiconidia calcicola]|uniref:Neural tube development n=1 Tax=Vermiconidia calcicola TaxID=1690605 RepID=A0ACC3N1L5_9PEZI|nr:neural tube development [Vermiconidia calcicola]
MSSKIPDCYICLKSFPTSRALLAHASCNGEERPFVCERCGKKFLTYGGQCDHEVDYGQLPYERLPHACAICGKGAANPAGSKIHVRNCYERAELKRRGELEWKKLTVAQEGDWRSLGPSLQRETTRTAVKAPAWSHLHHSYKPPSKFAAEHSSAHQPDDTREAVAAESLLSLSTLPRDFSIQQHSGSGARDLGPGRLIDTTSNARQVSAPGGTPNGQQVPAAPKSDYMQQLHHNQQMLARAQQNMQSQQQGGIAGINLPGNGMGQSFGGQQQGEIRPSQEANISRGPKISPPSPAHPDPIQQVNALSRPLQRPRNPVLIPSLDFLLPAIAAYFYTT